MRFKLWLLLAVFLVIVGLWPAAATPVVLAGAGLATLIAAIPGPALLAAAAIYLRRTATA